MNDEYKYIWRPAGSWGKTGSRPASPYHLVRDDGKTSKCGVAVVNKEGYKIRKFASPRMTAMQCQNCVNNRIVGA